MRPLLALILPVLIAACASPPARGPGDAPAAGTAAGAAATGAAAGQASAECQAAKLRPVAPMPVSLIPDEVLRRAQSGYVSVRYDLVAGRVRNATVASSSPPGLYDAYVLRHVNAHTDPGGATVTGCISTTDIKF